MRVSVFLATYNKADHLQTFLKSLRSQSHPPDELIVIDDGSTDNSLQVIEEHRLLVTYPVIVKSNTASKGLDQSIIEHLHLAQGDVILFAEQQNVWFADKIKKFHDVFDEEPLIRMVFSNAEIIDEQGQLYVPDYFGLTGFYERWDFFRNITDVLLKNERLMPGSFIAIDRKFLNKILDFLSNYPKLNLEIPLGEFVGLMYSLHYPPEFLQEIPYVLNQIRIPVSGELTTHIKSLKPFSINRAQQLNKTQKQDRINAFIHWLDKYKNLVTLYNSRHPLREVIARNIEFQNNRQLQEEQNKLVQILTATTHYLTQSYRKNLSEPFSEFISDCIS